MANTVEKVINIALAEVGYIEKKSNKDLDSKLGNGGSANYTKYARDIDNIANFYNGKKNGYPWCDVFVDWCLVKAFGAAEAKKLLCQPDKSCGAGCKFSMDYYKAKGQFFTNGPKVGDQIFFGSSKNDSNHTGLVYDVDDKYVYTIEGNTSTADGVVDNGGCVCKKKYSLVYSKIVGYGRPKYDVVEASAPTPTNVQITEGAKLMAKEVIRGVWKNEPIRSEMILKSIQHIVNEELEK